MNVFLTNEMKQWLQRKIEADLYFSASEVVREALYAKGTRNSQKIMRLRDSIQEGFVSTRESIYFESCSNGSTERLNAASLSLL